MQNEPQKMTWTEALDGPQSHRGTTLGQLSDERPTLVVFVRHSGCAFCRETLHALATHRGEIGERFHLAIVWMGDPMVARLLAERYGIDDIHRFVDASFRLHDAFEVPRGSFYQVIGPPVWWKGFLAALVRGHGLGKISGDVFRMPAAFVVDQRVVVSAFHAQFSSDSPDFAAIASE